MIPLLLAIAATMTAAPAPVVPGVCPQSRSRMAPGVSYRTNEMKVTTRGGGSYSVSCVMPARDGPIVWYPEISAPRDGTIVELRMGGQHPTYGLYGWQDGLGWRMVNQNDGSGYHPLRNGPPMADDHPGLHGDPVESIMGGFADITWRPYGGDPRHYEDPTRGAQWRCSYYIPAAACAAHGTRLGSGVTHP